MTQQEVMLQRRGLNSPGGPEAVLTELQAGPEELVVTEEMLRRRNEELVAVLQAADAERRRFQTVARDLDGLLSALVGLASWLVESSPTLPAEELQGYLRDITRRGLKMTRMVRDLLLLVGVLHQDVESQPLDMGGIVADVKQRLAGLIDASRAEFLDEPVEWPVVWGYVLWIEGVDLTGTRSSG